MATKTFTSEEVAVGDSTTVIHTMPGGFKTINFEVANTGEDALAGFAIQLKDHPDGEWYSLLADADFASTAISIKLFSSTAGPQDLAGDGKAHVILNVGCPESVRFTAICGESDATTVIVRGTVSFD